MCSICHQYTCPGSCPNAEEPPVFAVCDSCGEYIHHGDKYYEIGEYKYCEGCVSEETAEVFWYED